VRFIIKKLLDKKLYNSPSGTDISSLYLDDGYLFFNVDPVEVLVEGDSIDFEMRIFEGNQANINEIIVNGNTKTSDHVIIRELRTIPGQKFSRADIIVPKCNFLS
jgi:outer membrane protein insertion porin family